MGFKPGYCSDEGGWAEFKVNKKDVIALFRVKKGLSWSPAGGRVMFVVKDIKKARSALVKKGVRCSPITSVPNIVRFFVFKDSEGNPLEVYASW